MKREVFNMLSVVGAMLAHDRTGPTVAIPDAEFRAMVDAANKLLVAFMESRPTQPAAAVENRCATCKALLGAHCEPCRRRIVDAFVESTEADKPWRCKTCKALVGAGSWYCNEKCASVAPAPTGLQVLDAIDKAIGFPPSPKCKPFGVECATHGCRNRVATSRAAGYCAACKAKHHKEALRRRGQ